jgi:large subunit ribosomal protein L13
MKTFVQKKEEVSRNWHLVDADGLVLGRLATGIARLLMGKHKPTWTAHVDDGDHVVVVNAGGIRVTGKKMTDKIYYRHSGYPGGLSEQGFEDVMRTHPERIVEQAVRGMLPKNRLGRKVFKKLKVYAGPDHPHAGQVPQPYEIDARKVVS